MRTAHLHSVGLLPLDPCACARVLYHHTIASDWAARLSALIIEQRPQPIEPSLPKGLPIRNPSADQIQPF